MEKQYTIYIPYPKEQVLEKIKQTTKPLEFSNQAYRKTILSSYSEETESLCVSYAAGNMNGGGFEMMRMQIKDLGDNTILEGEFVPIPYIKKGVQLFFFYCYNINGSNFCGWRNFDFGGNNSYLLFSFVIII